MEAQDIENLVDAHYAPLYRFAISLSRSVHTGADLTQQTFYLWASRGYQLRDPSKVKAWLYTTLYREFLRQHRLDARDCPAPMGDDFENMPAESTPAMDAGAVLDALQSLREIFRAPLVMYYLEDLSYRDIAVVLRIPVGTVMSRLSRGKVMLRKLLATEGGEMPVPRVNKSKVRISVCGG